MGRSAASNPTPGGPASPSPVAERYDARRSAELPALPARSRPLRSSSRPTMQIQTPRLLPLLGSSLLLGLASCASSGGLGSMPVGIVELYDGAKPDGLMEVELARDGTVLEMEADVAPDALPAPIRDAALARLPGASITGAEREIHVDGRFWEVKLPHEGREWEVICDDAGKVVETEKELRRDEAPAGGARRGRPGRHRRQLPRASS